MSESDLKNDRGGENDAGDMVAVSEEETEDEEGRVPIDRGYAWIILAASWATMLMVNGVYKSFGIVFIEIQEKYNSNSSVTSLIVSCLNGTYSITGLLVQTVVLRHFSSRQCIVTGSLLLSLAYILSAFAPSVEIIIVLLGCVNGFGIGLVFLPTMTHLSQYFKKYRSLASCVAITGGSCGGLIFSFLIPLMVETYSFSGAMLILGAMSFHLVAFGLLMRPTEFYTQTKERSEIKTVKGVETNTVTRIENGIENGIEHGIENGTENGIENKSLLRLNPRWNKNVLSTQSLTIANSPLLRGSKVVRTNGTITRRNRTISEQSTGSFSSALQRSLSTLNRVGFYAGNELSVTSIPDMFHKNKQDKVNDNNSGSPTGKRKTGIRKRISSCIDCSALRRIPFLFYIPCACCLVTLSTLQTFIPPYAKDKGLSMKSSSLLVTFISITDACSNILWGIFADKHYVRIHKIVSITSVIIGIITFFTPMFDTEAALIAYSVAYGVFGRVFFSLYTPVIVNFLGLEYLNSALGIVSLAQTACIAVFVPVIGIIRDTYDSYVPGLLLVATVVTAGSLGILVLPFGEKCEKKKRQAMELIVEEA